MRFPLLLRFAIVAGVAVALLIPLSMIRDKVAERRDRAAAVQKSFADETSGPQVLAGPLLALTCEETYVDERVVHQTDGKPVTVREDKQRPCPLGLFLPTHLAIAGNVPLQTRHRGIYPIHLYEAALDLSGKFDVPPAPPQDGFRRIWKEAYLLLAISDVRGIKNAPSALIAGGSHEFLPGTIDARFKSGLHAPIGGYEDLKREPELGFRILLALAGTVRLQIAPVGRLNEIQIASAWPHPSFMGGYSPDQRTISSQGFTASWRVSQFATGGTSFWLDALASDKLFSNARLLGAALVEPVNAYSMSYRATEYGFLFVLLTFAAFGLVELVWGVKLHPMHYALTGSALAVFFLLLIALSEHIHFGWAYLGASVACVALLTFYLKYPLGSSARTTLFAALFASLYGALYVLLKSEDHSLLLGSLLVFGVLAAVMLLTRKLDWTQFSRRLHPAAAAADA
jgi:inner membrane protein